MREVTKHFTRHNIHRFAMFIDRPLTVLAVLVALIIYVGFAITGFQKENQQILKDTRKAAENTEVIIGNLETAVKDLKEDNSKQTQLIVCLLIFHGQNVAVSQEAQEKCQMTLENTDLSNTSTGSEEVQNPPTNTSPQSSNSGTETPNPPTTGEVPPDNDGVIVKLPLLPEIHIPSPL